MSSKPPDLSSGKEVPANQTTRGAKKDIASTLLFSAKKLSDKEFAEDILKLYQESKKGESSLKPTKR